MDGFTYHNIFDTKGIEYLVVIAFFAVLIPFWYLLNRKTKGAKLIQNAARLVTANSLRIPQGLFFSKYHTWTFLEKTGEAKVGMDDLLLHFTGEVTIDRLREPGEQIRKGELLTTINHNGKNLRILSPISGVIQETNADLTADSSPLQSNPYQEGWLYSILPSHWKAETNSCFLAEDASQWAFQELDRFKDFLATSVSKYLPEPPKVVLQDGGELINHPLAELPQEVWQDFQEAFLS